jgi:hypothetical protein
MLWILEPRLSTGKQVDAGKKVIGVTVTDVTKYRDFAVVLFIHRRFIEISSSISCRAKRVSNLSTVIPEVRS